MPSIRKTYMLTITVNGNNSIPTEEELNQCAALAADVVEDHLDSHWGFDDDLMIKVSIAPEETIQPLTRLYDTQCHKTVNLRGRR